jgi:hypothetical protein
MVRFTALAVAAAAVLVALHSGVLLLVLAALCGACGIAMLAGAPARR